MGRGDSCCGQGDLFYGFNLVMVGVGSMVAVTILGSDRDLCVCDRDGGQGLNFDDDFFCSGYRLDLIGVMESGRGVVVEWGFWVVGMGDTIL